MTECIYQKLLMRYHDGELSLEKAAGVEEHLQACADCAVEMKRLRGLSDLLNEDVAPAIPQGMIERLHANVRPVREYEIVRTCRWTAAVAATLLVTCVGWLAGSNALAGEKVSSPALWEMAAVSLETDTAEAVSEVAFAEWVVNDLSRGASR